MARKIEIEVTGDTRNLERALQGAQKSASGFQQGMQKASRGALIALGALGVGAVAAVKSASDLGEQINKTNVVFRGSEKSIIAWSETTASAFGISQRAALEAAGTFGNMLVPMGFAREEAGRMSQRMVELAADMASFNNASPEEVLEALRSGLAGQTEPLRRFGVFLNEARIEEEALRLGLVKQGKELDTAAKAQATYSIMLKDTTDAQGDFGRTSDSLANQQRILRAEIEDVASSLGNALLPAATAGAGALLGMVQTITDNEQAFKILINTVGALSGAIFLSNASLNIYNSTLLTTMKLSKGLRIAMAVTPWAAAAVAAGFLVEMLLKQGDEADDATQAQRGLTQAIRDYNSAISEAKKARDEHTQAGFRLEAADLAVTRAQQQLNQVEKGGHGGVVALREAQLNLSRALEERRLAEGDLARSGARLREEQGKQMNSASRVKAITEGLADTYKNRLKIATDSAQRQFTVLQKKQLGISTSADAAGDTIADYANELRKAASAAQQSNPKLAATARIAADLAEAWGRVVSLPQAREFVARFRVITTVEEHRSEVSRPRAAGGPVQAGVPYIVGELRPEVFVPSTAGRIVPRVPQQSSTSGGTRGRYMILADQDFVDFVRELDGRERRRNGGRGIL